MAYVRVFRYGFSRYSARGWGVGSAVAREPRDLGPRSGSRDTTVNTDAQPSRTVCHMRHLSPKTRSTLAPRAHTDPASRCVFTREKSPRTTRPRLRTISAPHRPRLPVCPPARKAPAPRDPAPAHNRPPHSFPPRPLYSPLLLSMGSRALQAATQAMQRLAAPFAIWALLKSVPQASRGECRVYVAGLPCSSSGSEPSGMGSMPGDWASEEKPLSVSGMSARTLRSDKPPAWCAAGSGGGNP